MGLSRILNARARTRYPNLEDSQLNSYQNFCSTGARTIESWIVPVGNYFDALTGIMLSCFWRALKREAYSVRSDARRKKNERERARAGPNRNE